MKMFSGFTPAASAFLARRFQFLALAEVCGECHNFCAELGLQPFQDDRGVETPGIGKNDLFRGGFRRGHGEFFPERCSVRLLH
jgi:hypothetical protein